MLMTVTQSSQFQFFSVFGFRKRENKERSALIASDGGDSEFVVVVVY